MTSVPQPDPLFRYVGRNPIAPLLTSGGVGVRPTREDLIAFEDECAAAFESAQIRAPIHLAGGNEDQLIAIFGHIQPDDYVYASYRQHFHALLHGVPRSRVMAEIMAGHSMHLTFPEHRFYSWAIVGGLLPIATGMAAALKRRGDPARVWCFCGDMGARMGIFHESTTYARNFALPINFVVEDNGYACDTPTSEVWGEHVEDEFMANPVQVYHYTRTRPHVGVGKWVTF